MKVRRQHAWFVAISTYFNSRSFGGNKAKASQEPMFASGGDAESKACTKSSSMESPSCDLQCRPATCVQSLRMRCKRLKPAKCPQYPRGTSRQTGESSLPTPTIVSSTSSSDEIAEPSSGYCVTVDCCTDDSVVLRPLFGPLPVIASSCGKEWPNKPSSSSTFFSRAWMYSGPLRFRSSSSYEHTISYQFVWSNAPESPTDVVRDTCSARLRTVALDFSPPAGGACPLDPRPFSRHRFFTHRDNESIRPLPYNSRKSPWFSTALVSSPTVSVEWHTLTAMIVAGRSFAVPPDIASVRSLRLLQCDLLLSKLEEHVLQFIQYSYDRQSFW